MIQEANVQTKTEEAYMPDQRAECIPSPKWVRVFFGNELIADSKRVTLLRQKGRLPVYYFPRQDVRMDLLRPSEPGPEALPQPEGASFWTIKVGDKLAENAAWSLPAPADVAHLEPHLAFEWDKMEAWFEEDEQVHVHPRDPYKRIDVIHSSRYVQVIIAGETVAETKRPVLLFETGLPTRHYFPRLDVRLELLEPSDKQTRCAYKGTASHYSVKVGDSLVKDIAWFYPFPNPEFAKIQNMICFYQERLDDFYVDGERVEKPKTPWS